jgi:transcriptional regulator with XRE-family HTH domain
MSLKTFKSMAHLGNNIARIRSFRRVPQKDMAARLGITQQEYSRIEKKETVEEDILVKIAAELDFPVEAIKEMESSTTVQTVYQQNGNNGNGFYQNSNEKIVELYERLLLEKDTVINEQKEVIEIFKKQLK